MNKQQLIDSIYKLFGCLIGEESTDESALHREILSEETDDVTRIYKLTRYIALRVQLQEFIGRDEFIAETHTNACILIGLIHDAARVQSSSLKEYLADRPFPDNIVAKFFIHMETGALIDVGLVQVRKNCQYQVLYDRLQKKSRQQAVVFSKRYGITLTPYSASKEMRQLYAEVNSITPAEPRCRAQNGLCPGMIKANGYCASHMRLLEKREEMLDRMAVIHLQLKSKSLRPDEALFQFGGAAADALVLERFLTSCGVSDFTESDQYLFQSMSILCTHIWKITESKQIDYQNYLPFKFDLAESSKILLVHRHSGVALNPNNIQFKGSNNIVTNARVFAEVCLDSMWDTVPEESDLKKVTETLGMLFHCCTALDQKDGLEKLAHIKSKTYSFKLHDFVDAPQIPEYTSYRDMIAEVNLLQAGLKKVRVRVLSLAKDLPLEDAPIESVFDSLKVYARSFSESVHRMSSRSDATSQRGILLKTMHQGMCSDENRLVCCLSSNCGLTDLIEYNNLIQQIRDYDTSSSSDQSSISSDSSSGSKRRRRRRRHKCQL
jgi:hypothetical protein